MVKVLHVHRLENHLENVGKHSLPPILFVTRYCSKYSPPQSYNFFYPGTRPDHGGGEREGQEVPDKVSSAEALSWGINPSPALYIPL